jgi:hypothetical protein
MTPIIAIAHAMANVNASELNEGMVIDFID